MPVCRRQAGMITGQAGTSSLKPADISSTSSCAARQIRDGGRSVRRRPRLEGRRPSPAGRGRLRHGESGHEPPESSHALAFATSSFRGKPESTPKGMSGGRAASGTNRRGERSQDAGWISMRVINQDQGCVIIPARRECILKTTGFRLSPE